MFIISSSLHCSRSLTFWIQTSRPSRELSELDEQREIWGRQHFNFKLRSSWEFSATCQPSLQNKQLYASVATKVQECIWTLFPRNKLNRKRNRKMEIIYVSRHTRKTQSDHVEKPRRRIELPANQNIKRARKMWDAEEGRTIDQRYSVFFGKREQRI